MRYRLVDAAGSELEIVEDERPEISHDERVRASDGSWLTVVEVYDDADGQDGGVAATLVVEAD